MSAPHGMMEPMTALLSERLRSHRLTAPARTPVAAARHLLAVQGQEFLAGRWALGIRSSGAPTLAAVSGPVTELKVTDDVAGTGTAAEAGSTVTVQYVGAVADTGKVFDESWSSGQPVTFPLDRVIPGWSQGLVGMKEGGRRTLVIPAELAYGANPPPGSGIPADAALVFTVDLVKVD